LLGAALRGYEAFLTLPDEGRRAKKPLAGAGGGRVKGGGGCVRAESECPASGKRAKALNGENWVGKRRTAFAEASESPPSLSCDLSDQHLKPPAHPQKRREEPSNEALKPFVGKHASDLDPA
jgi:hypothetical protein